MATNVQDPALRPGRRRGALARDLGARGRLRRAEPGSGRHGRALLRARDAALPVGRAAHGSRQELHDGRRRRRCTSAATGDRVMHPMGYDAFGLPAENAAIRSGRHPAESTRENIAAIRRQMKRMGWSIDWNARALDVRAGVLPLDAVDLPAPLRGGPRVPQERRRQVVPQGSDRARERAGHRRALRALRHRGRGAHARPVVLQDHRLRRPAARRPGARAAGPSGS